MLNDLLGPRHSMISTFYNDLYAFDMDRKRWYKLGLKQQKTKLTTAEKQEIRKAKLNGTMNTKAKDSEDEEENDESEQDEDDEEDDEEENIIFKNEKMREKQINSGELFGYIDESGAVVYVYLEEDENDDEDQILSLEQSSPSSDLAEVEQVQVAIVETQNETSTGIENELAAATINETDKDTEKAQLSPEGATQLVTSFFDEQLQPCSRINPCLMMRYFEFHFLHQDVVSGELLFFVLYFLEAIRYLSMEELQNWAILK